MKVIAAGVIYWVLALIDGVVRSRTDTFDTDDRTPLVTMALLFFMDSFIFYWAMTALIGVRRALRLRKNYVKLAMYNHFAYTLIFSLLATLAFTIWLFVEVNFPKAGCLEDWQEVWLRDCFWHFLFVIVLIVIMIIWRPSANRNRFAYSLVNDLDQEDEEEEERMENKNFETVKMRSVSRGDAGTPPPISSTQAVRNLYLDHCCYF
jgi:type VI protein secretion system component VasK